MVTFACLKVWFLLCNLLALSSKSFIVNRVSCSLFNCSSPLCPATLCLNLYPLCLKGSASVVSCSPLEKQIFPNFRHWENSVFVLLHRKGSFWCTESNCECLILPHSSMVHLTHALPVLIYRAYSRAWQTVRSLKIKSSNFHVSWHRSVCYSKVNNTLGRLSGCLRYLLMPILCLKMKSLDLSLGLLWDFTASLNVFSFSASAMLTWLFLNATTILKNNKKPQSVRLFEESRAII